MRSDDDIEPEAHVWLLLVPLGGGGESPLLAMLTENEARYAAECHGGRAFRVDAIGDLARRIGRAAQPVAEPAPGDTFKRRKADTDTMQCGCRWERREGFGDVLVLCPIHKQASDVSYAKHERERRLARPAAEPAPRNETESQRYTRHAWEHALGIPSEPPADPPPDDGEPQGQALCGVCQGFVRFEEDGTCHSCGADVVAPSTLVRLGLVPPADPPSPEPTELELAVRQMLEATAGQGGHVFTARERLSRAAFHGPWTIVQRLEAMDAQAVAVCEMFASYGWVCGGSTIVDAVRNICELAKKKREPAPPPSEPPKEMP